MVVASMSCVRLSRPRPIASFVSAAASAALLLAGGVQAQALGPKFEDHYTITDLGSVPGVTASYGGAIFASGDTSTAHRGPPPTR